MPNRIVKEKKSKYQKRRKTLWISTFAYISFTMIDDNQNQIEDYFEKKKNLLNSFFLLVNYGLIVNQNVVDSLAIVCKFLFFSFLFFLTKREFESLQQTKEMKKWVTSNIFSFLIFWASWPLMSGRFFFQSGDWWS